VSPKERLVRAAEEVDQVLAILAGISLTTFSVDGTMVITHRLVMRVIMENLATREKYRSSLFFSVGEVLKGVTGRGPTAPPPDDRLAMMQDLYEEPKERLARMQNLDEQKHALYRASLSCVEAPSSSRH